MSAKNPTTKKKHVFLFRHCVRSTDSNVYLFNHTYDNTDNNDDDASIPIINFWSRLAQPEVILPKWNVPKNWCTENGMIQMQQTGSHIYNALLSRPVEEGSHGRKLKFRFISDTLQRDVDTTFALQEGIASAMLSDTTNKDLYQEDGSSSSSSSTTSTISLASTNLHAAEYIPNLFQPFISTTMSPTPMCTLQVTKQQRQDEVQHRLNTMVPKPPSNIYSVLRLLQIDGLNMMDVDAMNNITITSDSLDRPQLSGMVNFLKLVAQLIFYSRCSGIVPRQFLYRITTPQLYTILLPYIYYTRSILNVGTTEAATRGALLARTMMEAIQLDAPSMGTLSDVDDDNNDVDTVTIIVGHDTDLDAVATAMNAAWEFDVPYNNNMNSSLFLWWYMTPPGSAIYLSHETNVDNGSTDEDTKVTMSYFHPIFDVDKNDGSIISYDMVPLQLLNYSNNNGNTNLYLIQNNSTTIRWNELQRHINVTLQQYVGASDCYFNTRPVAGLQQYDKTGSNYSSNESDNGPIVDSHTNPINNPATTPTVMTPSMGDSLIGPTIGRDDDEPISKSWGSGFVSGIAASILLVVLFWLYHRRQQRRLRSQYSQPHHPSKALTSLQLNEYSDADDSATVTTNNRGRAKRHMDII